MTEEQIYSLCEALSDIAYIAGENKYYSGDERKDRADFIEWAKEFEKINEGVQWGINSEIDFPDAIEEFAYTKIKEAE